MRTWRWHRLLKGGRDGRLTAEEQKGLIGELIFLGQYVVPTIGVGQGVRSWVGPLGAKRDFEIGIVAVECKAHAPLASTLRITSADQLDSTRESPLFLHVIEIAEARSQVAEAVTVTDVVDGVLQQIEAADVAVQGEFEERLWAVGYDNADDYTHRQWVIGDGSLFRVVDKFPRITPQILPAGVTQVCYCVALSLCERFRVEPAVVVQSILKDRNDHTRVR